MKVTLASMKRELDEFKAQAGPSGRNGNGLLTQSDLDALLAQAATQNQGRQPRIVAPVKEKSRRMTRPEMPVTCRVRSIRQR